MLSGSVVLFLKVWRGANIVKQRQKHAIWEVLSIVGLVETGIAVTSSIEGINCAYSVFLSSSLLFIWQNDTRFIVSFVRFFGRVWHFDFVFSG